jgi:hypothetical protein
MKAVAFVMMICLVFLSGFTGNAKSLTASTKENCCHQKAKQSTPCSAEHKGDGCNEMCNPVFSCAGCGFLKVNRLSVNPAPFVLKEVSLTIYYMGDLSDYSAVNWNPPKV